MKNVYVLTHIDFYKTFFDHGWARQLDELVAGTKLASPAFSLCMYWKAAVNTHAMPWMMIASLKSFWSGTVNGDRSAADRAIWHIVREVPTAMAPHVTNMGRKKLTEVMSGAGDRWKAGQEMSPVEAVSAQGSRAPRSGSAPRFRPPRRPRPRLLRALRPRASLIPTGSRSTRPPDPADPDAGPSGCQCWRALAPADGPRSAGRSRPGRPGRARGPRA